MIVCHCQNISCHDIHAAVDWMRASDPDTLITPGRVYRVLGKSVNCGGCLPLFLDTMRQNRNLQVRMQRSSSKIDMRGTSRHERRPKSHRVPQSSSTQ
ncbi:MAG: (2Fe-2S)-binding protein [Aestuariivita sp.]|nr:(2Fe-2S)-binding protein [Aestuariivita sp.]